MPIINTYRRLRNDFNNVNIIKNNMSLKILAANVRSNELYYIHNEESNNFWTMKIPHSQNC